jgi:integrase
MAQKPLRKLLRGMGSLKKVKTCTHTDPRCKCKWVARWYPYPGAKEAQETFDDYDAGYDHLLKIYEKKRADGGKTAKAKAAKIQGPAPTLAEYAEKWVREKRGVSSNTKVRYRTDLRVHAIPYFRDTRRIDDITHEQFGDFITHLYDQGVYAGTVELLCRFVLRPIFRKAMTEGLIDSNPADDHTYENVPKPKRYVPTSAEVHAIATAIQPEFRLAVYLMYGAGMRVGEAIAQTTELLDLGGGYAHISRQFLADGTFGNLKDDREGIGRFVPIDDFLAAEIRLHIERFGVEPGGLLFPSPRKLGVPYRTHTFDEALRKVLLKLRLDHKDITAHNFRHAFATRCLLAKMQVPVVSSMLGHQDVKTTVKTYFHLLTPEWAEISTTVHGFLAADLPEGHEYAPAAPVADKQAQVLALLAQLKELGHEVQLAA